MNGMNAMKDYFFEISKCLEGLVSSSEFFTCFFSGEHSTFVRFNQAKVRQAGTVLQRYIQLDLIRDSRHVVIDVSLTGEMGSDRELLAQRVREARSMLEHVPPDPHLLYQSNPGGTERLASASSPSADEAVADILRNGEGLDLVGLYAGGEMCFGFSNAAGRRDFFASASHHFDYSLCIGRDKAVKAAYASPSWNSQSFEENLSASRTQLAHLGRDDKSLEPGKYRVYLSPSALREVMSVVSWGGFGLRDHRTKRTGLLHLIEGEKSLSSSITWVENTKDGSGPPFQTSGVSKPDRVTLVERGEYRNCLVSPRSAKEYGVATNGASEGEDPEALHMNGGDLDTSKILSELGTGLYISNLWYLNYSDRAAGRMTGMTRFATFWVENGQIKSPVSAMRFDESLFHIFGTGLVGLSRETELLLDSDTYGRRSTRSSRLPGALVDGFTFTL